MGMSSLCISFFYSGRDDGDTDSEDDAANFVEDDLDKSDRQQINQQYKGNCHTVIADTRCNQFEELSHIFLYNKVYPPKCQATFASISASFSAGIKLII